MPRTKEQFEDIRSQRIELIENIAMHCFAEKGFHNTTISYIAKEAGISTGLTYNYFSSKEDLLKSIYLKGVKKAFSPLMEKALAEGKFKDFIEHIFNEVESNKEFWKLYFIVISQPDTMSQFQAYVLEILMPILTSITGYFKSKGVEEPELETQFLFSTLDGISINFLFNSDHYPLQKIKQKLLKNYE